jgi:acetylornithine deacetylase
MLAKSLIAVLVVGDTKELPLLSMTCTTDARFYFSIHHNQEEVVVACYGPDATNIHGIDESASLVESMRVVTAAITLFVRDWCGLEKCSD